MGSVCWRGALRSWSYLLSCRLGSGTCPGVCLAVQVFWSAVCLVCKLTAQRSMVLASY